ncbi:MAG: DNA polymerase/3'-5' exonuclease PolX [Opitutaceae bacterium]|nr:DNA polymerase/3'-5' exonuclease PolX [Cytophagales bacterium]
MTNREISKMFKLTASLMELHEENPFKSKAYNDAVFAIDKISQDLSDLTPQELEKTGGFGKSIISKIEEIKTTGTFSDLENLISNTPHGVVKMLGIKGIGPKKVRIIWKEAGIEGIEKLYEACENDKICQLKGFGEKTQQTILENIVFLLEQEGSLYYADVEPVAKLIDGHLSTSGFKYSLSGETRRFLETVEKLQFLVAENNPKKVFEFIDKIPGLEKSNKESSPFSWRGKTLLSGIKVEIKVCKPEEFGSKLIIDSSSQQHLEHCVNENESLYKHFRKNNFQDEETAYASINFPVILPELREGILEFHEKNKAIISDPKALIQYADLKGTLHNHTTYSDGEHTLLQMAEKCISLGLEYFGVADHSKSAQYAGGMYEDKVLKQQAEIDELNKKLAPFKIIKGIESDILSDGSLDYEDDILKTFDYVVASIHSGFKMDESKATQRLIKAVENQYTTILGHPTGRLLLRRPGYKMDHKKVIDACADNGVCIEINANPYRLDIDWRWIPYALEKGAMLSINPDAHDIDEIYNMYFGVCVARKGGLTKSNCLNAFGLKEIEELFIKTKQPAL